MQKEVKCGCESEPYKTVNNVEAKLYYGIYLNIQNHGGFVICNEEIVPEEILLMAEDAKFNGIDVIVSGDLHKGGTEGRLVILSGITLTEIKLPKK